MNNYVTIGFKDSETAKRFYDAVGELQGIGGSGYPSAVWSCDTIGLLHRDNVTGVIANMVSGTTKSVIVEVLCEQALADHVGDVRDVEVKLWGLLGIDEKGIVRGYDSAWKNTEATLRRHGIPLPSWLDDDNG